MIQTGWTCKFCERDFKLEARFLKHRCKQMIRDEEFRTPRGHAAWSYYQKWMKAYRRMIPSPHSFLKSKFYSAFMNFVRRSEELNIPDVDLFVSLMKAKDIPPTMWCEDRVYSLYIEFLDRRADPMGQAKITVSTLFEVADKYEVDVGDIFTVIPVHEVIQLFRQRKLSPWLMLQCSKFKRFFVEKTSQEEKIILETIIRPQYWGFKFDKHSADVSKMKIYAKELNL